MSHLRLELTEKEEDIVKELRNNLKNKSIPITSKEGLIKYALKHTLRTHQLLDEYNLYDIENLRKLLTQEPDIKK